MAGKKKGAKSKIPRARASPLPLREVKRGPPASQPHAHAHRTRGPQNAHDRPAARKKQPPVRSAGSKPNTAARGGQRRAATIHQNKSRRNAEGPPETETPTPPNEQEERRRRCLRSTSSRDQKPQTGQKTREKDEGNEKAKQKCLMPKLRVPLRSEHAPGSCRPADVAARLPLPLTHAQLPTRRAALPDDPTGMGGRIGNAVRCWCERNSRSAVARLRAGWARLRASGLGVASCMRATWRLLCESKQSIGGGSAAGRRGSAVHAAGDQRDRACSSHVR